MVTAHHVLAAGEAAFSTLQLTFATALSIMHADAVCKQAGCLQVLRGGVGWGERAVPADACTHCMHLFAVHWSTRPCS